MNYNKFNNITVQKTKKPEINYPIVTSEKKGKLIISSELKSQIDLFHLIAGSTEWSGILLYNVTKGDIENPKDLLIETKAMFPMDIGTPGYTEYDYDERVLDMYDLYPNALTEEWRLGHIHTHHNMGAYFSGTDLQELKDNIDNHAYYLSLIVNFEGKYCAKLCVKAERNMTQKSTLKYSGLFSDKENDLTLNSEKKESIVYSVDLDIELPQEEENSISFIGEIIKLKNTSKKGNYSWGNSSSDYRRNSTINLDTGKQVSLWDDVMTDGEAYVNEVDTITSFLCKVITVDPESKLDKGETFKEFLSKYNKKYLNMTSGDKVSYHSYMNDNIWNIAQNTARDESYYAEENLLEDSIKYLKIFKGVSVLASTLDEVIKDCLNEFGSTF